MSYFQVWPCTPPQELYSTRSVHKPLLLPQTLTIPLIVHISYQTFWCVVSLNIVKTQTASKKYSAILHTMTSNKFLMSDCFFSVKSFCSFLIKWEKQSGQRSVACTADWLNKFFLSYRITNDPNNCTILQDLYSTGALFVLSFVQLDNKIHSRCSQL